MSKQGLANGIIGKRHDSIANALSKNNGCNESQTNVKKVSQIVPKEFPLDTNNPAFGNIASPKANSGLSSKAVSSLITNSVQQH